uniref:Uncharacterized protein n=1 Tax=Octactis speculum TaxID=3111310 RepID=A0A7S2C1G4_9STRA|mmetsp:Transcript_30197/g.40945  ORF Transcript_30197/g.40945 Transcript_30197/m.40945 type:complete len:130 (+) Transcript_30197:528-917(+)
MFISKIHRKLCRTPTIESDGLSARMSGNHRRAIQIFRSTEAGLDPTPADGKYFPELVMNEANAINVSGEEMEITEEESALASVQEPNQKDTPDYSGYPLFRDEPLPEHGLELCSGMDKNMPCALFKRTL